MPPTAKRREVGAHTYFRRSNGSGGIYALTDIEVYLREGYVAPVLAQSKRRSGL